MSTEKFYKYGTYEWGRSYPPKHEKLDYKCAVRQEGNGDVRVMVAGKLVEMLTTADTISDIGDVAARGWTAQLAAQLAAQFGFKIIFHFEERTHAMSTEKFYKYGTYEWGRSYPPKHEKLDYKCAVRIHHFVRKMEKKQGCDWLGEIFERSVEDLSQSDKFEIIYTMNQLKEKVRMYQYDLPRRTGDAVYSRRPESEAKDREDRFDEAVRHHKLDPTLSILKNLENKIKAGDHLRVAQIYQSIRVLHNKPLEGEDRKKKKKDKNEEKEKRDKKDKNEQKEKAKKKMSSESSDSSSAEDMERDKSSEEKKRERMESAEEIHARQERKVKYKSSQRRQEEEEEREEETEEVHEGRDYKRHYATKASMSAPKLSQANKKKDKVVIELSSDESAPEKEYDLGTDEMMMNDPGVRDYMEEWSVPSPPSTTQSNATRGPEVDTKYSLEMMEELLVEVCLEYIHHREEQTLVIEAAFSNFRQVTELKLRSAMSLIGDKLPAIQEKNYKTPFKGAVPKDDAEATALKLHKKNEAALIEKLNSKLGRPLANSSQRVLLMTTYLRDCARTLFSQCIDQHFLMHRRLKHWTIPKENEEVIKYMVLPSILTLSHTLTGTLGSIGG
ncbi:hypothetical protein PROFUN_03280 [Planoprotostelium fungivorum]|uniref:Rhodanese domain-containing protein n=1 Tax=Planoprotostelium fungivorum TaxID=1890364 RepID=A0A2P6NWQ9_9EUKA|nr:hypothetical protein PROFUN_03280 [Planoprotostelium fungivorum]